MRPRLTPSVATRFLAVRGIAVLLSVGLFGGGLLGPGLTASGAQDEPPKKQPAKPDAKKPDDAKPDAAKPDGKKPDNAKPDDTKPDGKKPDDAQTEKPKPPTATAEELKEWQTLWARRTEIAESLSRLKRDFADADVNRKRKIRAEFEALLDEFRSKMQARILELAPLVYAKDPQRVHAGEIVLRTAWDRGDVPKSMELAASLMTAGHQSAYVLNTAGAAYCVEQQFDQAKRVLELAEGEGKLDPVRGQRNLELARAYVTFASNPKDLKSAERVAENAYLTNQYQQTLDIVRDQIAAGNKTESILSYGGTAHFANNEFTQAVQLLEEAKAADLLNPEAERTLETAQEYVALWKTEQALRKAEQAATGDTQLPRVLIKTNQGDIEVLLCENEAPNTVANFVHLAENKKYDGLKFHRVEPNFVIQGGDPNSKDDDPSNDGQGGPGYQIPCECFGDKARLHFRGSLSMAHSGKDTGGSQFFITHRPTAHLNPDTEAEKGHTVFGYVTKGMDVVDKIRAGDTITSMQVLAKRNHKYLPRKVGDPEPPTLDKPDPGKPDPGKPEADKPDPGKPEADKPDGNKPEAGGSDPKASSSDKPDSKSKPDSKP